MGKYLRIIPLLVLSARLGHAQVQLEVTSNQSVFLPGEKIEVIVRIYNQSGRTLKLAARPDWLQFGVESKTGRSVFKRSEVPVEGEFELESASRATFRVNLAPHFELEEPGHYICVARMTEPVLGVILTSQPLGFDIVSGSRLWSELVGVPPKPGEPDSIAVRRKYLLQQVNHVKQLRLYIRVTDATESRTFGVQYIGPMILFNRPLTLVDGRSRLHVLHQNGARSYFYHLIGPEGDLIERRTYDLAEGRPLLRLNDTGEVLITGGVRRFNPTDFPPAEDRNPAPRKDVEP